MKKKIATSLVGMSLLIPLSGCGTDSNHNSLQISKDVEFGEQDYEKIITPNNELGFNLLDEVEKDDDGNLFISPTSLLMALALVYNGADGVTKEEIAIALQIPEMDATELNKANASLMTMLNKATDGIQLQVANSIWLNEDYRFQDDFAKRAKDYFNAEIQEIDIASDDSPKRINNWVKEATNGKIDKMVEGNLDENLVAMLLNAIYFKGDWQYPFDKRLTENRTFHLADGNKINAPFMSLQEKLSYMANSDYQAIKLPYADGGMSMTIVLPNDLKKFESDLSAESWEKIQSGMKKTRGTILLPKFKLAYETELNEALKALGMKSAFKEGANFSKMIEGDESLLINRVKQKTYIDVNEEGTEAAAVTGVEVGVTSAPPDDPFIMEVNRPFFIAITDDETGAILFMGSISNPTVK
ncbi:serpin family protein [Sporosarcina thermotolerans]|uniref:Serpin family protein n=1 Tax=Sporosarcina thermotolerans TaxID=633404 RepID=A0AAW9AB76_9BACL|nr:serpin family protein [Sporosarcina thermotolerans]MDW0118752.1 serpin family protein [Sporosarcina thermotolerans]